MSHSTSTWPACSWRRLARRPARARRRRVRRRVAVGRLGARRCGAGADAGAAGACGRTGGRFEHQQQRTFVHLVADLDLQFLDHAGVESMDLHAGLVRLHRDQRLVDLDRVADLDHQLDDLDFLEVADVRDFDFNSAHILVSIVISWEN
jgi:hypothetical protein